MKITSRKYAELSEVAEARAENLKAEMKSIEAAIAVSSCLAHTEMIKDYDGALREYLCQLRVAKIYGEIAADLEALLDSSKCQSCGAINSQFVDDDEIDPDFICEFCGSDSCDCDML